MEKIVFLNGGWMSSYNGIKGDNIKQGGSYIAEHNFGGEVYNFRNDGGYAYGYVMTRGGTINLGRIVNNNKVKEDFLTNVLCIFIATHPSGGRKIVGWYENAKAYKKYRVDENLNRPDKGKLLEPHNGSNQVGYFIKTEYKNTILLSEDERLYAPPIPTGKGGFGQSQVWYADSECGKKVVKSVLEFIRAYSKDKKEENLKEKKRKTEAKKILNQ